MREIKFRAWHKPTKQYTIQSFWKYGDNEEYEETGDHLAISIDGCLCDEGYGNGMSGVQNSDDYIIEQYTGVKDKNGKEIYEGDILGCKHSAQSPYSRSNRNIRVVRENPKTHQLGLFGDTNSDYEATGFGLSETTKNRFEVIGNIHENEELL